MTLDNGGESSAQPFQIKLEGCNLKGDNQVAVTFKGTEAGKDQVIYRLQVMLLVPQ
ncbi:hypothetical protein AB6F61_12900 [Providencia hangzhouensis]